MEGRFWMNEAIKKGAKIFPHMEPNGIYMHAMYTTCFLKFESLEQAHEFRDFADKNIPYWDYDGVAIIDTNDPDICKRWSNHIKQKEPGE